MAKKNRIDLKTKPKDNPPNTACGLIITLLVSSIPTIAVSIGLYFLYEDFTAIPQLPKLDLNVWWGPNYTKDAQDTTIRPFRVVFTDAMQEQLVKKFVFYHQRPHPPSLEDSACRYGINSAGLDKIFHHWQFNYDLKERQKFFNKFDHFKTNVQGLDIHFIKVTPNPGDNIKVLPILLLHGWPGSVREFYELIPLLTTRRPGYDFVFEVIAPSLPGFAFSQAPIRSGLNPVNLAIIMRNLMHRLGFKSYFIQGGDFGHIIGSNMATLFPKEVLGFHSNFLADLSTISALKVVFGSLWPNFFVEKNCEDRIYSLKDNFFFLWEATGYLHLQSTKPDTIGVSLNDSPLGLASYILDRFMVFTDPSNKNLIDGGLSKYYNLTNLLDNVMLYWSTGSITTSMRLYKESFAKFTEIDNAVNRNPTPVPTWGLQAKYELIYQPQCIIKQKYPHLLGLTTIKDGGHFLAFEKPDVVANDVFQAIKIFQDYNKSVRNKQYKKH